MPFEKGMIRPPDAGRKAGVPNKRTVNIREIFDDAFNALGGLERIVQWANKSDDNLKEFYKIYSKFIPFSVVGNGSNVQIVVDAKAKDL